jgi:endonuclease/exonuclease/phosphatase (EEP) superfamily protein YafD
VNIISWNLWHTRGAGPEQLAALIATHKPDLLLMQEATAIIDVLPKLCPGHYARITLPGRHHGLAAWSSAPWASPAISLKLQRGLVFRRVAQILSPPGLTIANVHLSHGQWLNRFQLRQIAAALPGPAAILGDCNMVGAPNLPGYTDSGPRRATHKSARLIPLRLDRCFTKNLLCTEAEVLDYGLSDHKPIKVSLAALQSAIV